MEDIKNATLLHYVVRQKPNKEKKPIKVEAIFAINPFMKPGCTYESVSINEKNLEKFYELLEGGWIEAYFYH